jgi:hypothetical protein
MGALVIALIKLKFSYFYAANQMDIHFEVKRARHVLETDPHSLDIFEAMEMAERIEAADQALFKRRVVGAVQAICLAGIAGGVAVLCYHCGESITDSIADLLAIGALVSS